MRILFDQAAHDMRNKGNNALLEVAMERVAAFWPDAAASVITLAPHLTRLYFPSLEPVDPHALRPIHRRADRLHRVVPRVAWRLMLEGREALWHRRTAGLDARAGRTTTRGKSPHSMPVPSTPAPLEAAASPRPRDLAAGRRAIERYDLYVASGGGYMCDSDKPLLMAVFDRIEAAASAGVPAIMVGQGVGPLDDAELRARASQVLPMADLICVRERRLALPLLSACGVPADRVVMTGDDALELPFRARRPRLGGDLGVSVRLSPYTGVGARHLGPVRAALHRAAASRGATLVGVPISAAHHESDYRQIGRLFDGFPRTSLGLARLDTPARSIAKAARCRVMVAGTYHGAIFALGQGIPVVALASSREYRDKLAGLEDEFGTACRLLSLDDEEVERQLGEAVDAAWEAADARRGALLDVVERHLDWQRLAYARVPAIVDAARRARAAKGSH